MFSVSWEWNRWNGFSDNLGFFPHFITSTRPWWGEKCIHHNKRRSVCTLLAKSGRVSGSGEAFLSSRSLATTDNEWSGFWVLIRGIVDNEEAATQARGPVTGPPLVTLSNYIQYQDMWGMRGLLSIMDSDKPEIFWLTFLAVPGTPPHVTTLSAAENGGFERMGQGKILLHSPHISVRILREAPHMFSLFRFRPFAFILPWWNLTFQFPML